jgi:hypothetical protein
MRIKAIRFEPGTIAVDMTRLDVVKRSEGVRLAEDEIGVWVGDERIPWHRVQSAQYEHTERVDMLPGAPKPTKRK